MYFNYHPFHTDPNDQLFVTLTLQNERKISNVRENLHFFGDSINAFSFILLVNNFFYLAIINDMIIDYHH